MSSTSAKRASRASVLISYALAKQALKPLQDGAITQPLMGQGEADRSRRSATMKEPGASDQGSTSGAGNDESLGEQEEDSGSNLRSGGAMDWSGATRAAPGAAGQGTSAAPAVQELRQTGIRSNDAFSQQVLSRLNHRIKQQKRNEKQLDTACARLTKKLYKATKHLKVVALGILVLLPFFTKPRWCVDEWGGKTDAESKEKYANCGYNPQFAADALKEGKEDYQMLGTPNSGSPKLEPEVQAVIEAICYFALLYFTAIRLCLKKVTKTARLRCGVMTSLLLYLIGANILALVIGFRRYATQQIISFLILMFFIRSLRESWKRIFLVVWDALAIAVIIIAYLVAASLLGFTLFSNAKYNDPSSAFRDFPSAMWNVYVLFTTSNFPDILFPFWKVNGISVLYFIAFLLIGLYMLLNLMLAVFYNSYKQQVERKIAKYDTLREEFLKKEFQSIGNPLQDSISTEEFRSKYGAKVINQSEKTQQLLTQIETEKELGISDGLIYFEDFAYMYMFLEFTAKKAEKKKNSQLQMRRRGVAKRDQSKGARKSTKATSKREESSSSKQAGNGAVVGEEASDLGDKGAQKLQRNVINLNDSSKSDMSELDHESDKDESSDDSFESDSDFDDLLDGGAESGRVGPDGAPIGYRKRSWCSRMAKRHSRRFARTSCGKRMLAFSDVVATTCLAKAVAAWYGSIYSGSIMLTLGIVNLMSIPYLHFYEDAEDWVGLSAAFSIQIVANFLYLVDFVVMLAIYGVWPVFAKRSWALRAELVAIAAQLWWLPAYFCLLRLEAQQKAAGNGKLIVDTRSLSSEFSATSKALDCRQQVQQLVDVQQLAILIRLLRITTFLEELEQWQFFAKAVRVMRGPFFNLCFTLYSLYMLYVLIGMEIFGGKITSTAFENLFEANPDTGVAPDYIWLNFNDFASGLLTLFSMMLFNNWQYIWEQFDFTIRARTVTNCYFLSFMVLATYVIINILMAFVIDVYTSIEDAQKEEREERKAIIDFGRRATIAPGTTGTEAVRGRLSNSRISNTGLFGAQPRRSATEVIKPAAANLGNTKSTNQASSGDQARYSAVLADLGAAAGIVEEKSSSSSESSPGPSRRRSSRKKSTKRKSEASLEEQSPEKEEVSNAIN